MKQSANSVRIEMSLSRVGRGLLAGLAELDKRVVNAVNCARR